MSSLTAVAAARQSKLVLCPRLTSSLAAPELRPFGTKMREGSRGAAV